MIIKNFEAYKINLKEYNYFLFYGENSGHKKEIIELLLKKKGIDKITYTENEVLNNSEEFLNSIISKSFFETEKFIIINSVTDKFINIIDRIIETDIRDTYIILEANELVKKSKIRNLFEKKKNLICVPFYPDNYQTLSHKTSNYFKKKNIPISREIINLLVDRSNGSRQHLENEISKIDNFLVNKKSLSFEEVQKLSNLGQNYDISELVDNCLAKNKNKISKIMNDNNFSSDDAIIIIRTFLNKTKRLFLIKNEIENESDLDKVISNFKPPIFWKDKDLIKRQVELWTLDNIQNLIIEITDTELTIKKNFTNSINIIQNFIFDKVSSVSN